jgi:hypothetical protein
MRVPVVDGETLLPVVSCHNCRHLAPGGALRCAAYPDGIPLPILSGDVVHDRPLPGDHGVQFAWYEEFEPAEWVPRQPAMAEHG